MIRTEALRVFVTVAGCGNIKDAAKQLFRTQSAISMTLKQIEDQLGAPLFETDRKHSLTDLGAFVLDVAKVLLRDHDRAQHLIAEYASGVSGRLRIASVPSVATLMIPDLLASFLVSRPTAQIDLVDSDSADVRRRVASGQADLGIAGAASDCVGVVQRPLFEDAMQVVCRADTDLARQGAAVAWESLATAPLILNETTRGIRAVAFQGLAAQAKLRVRNVTSLLAMVRAGIGITLLPRLATMALPPDLVALPLQDQSCLRQVCLLQRDGRVQSPLASAFQQHVLAALPALAGQLGITPASAPVRGPESARPR